MSKKIGLHELDVKDPLRADHILWNRQADPLTRRGFLRGSGLLLLGLFRR